MLFWLLPLAVAFGFGFASISVWNRGEIAAMFGIGAFAGVITLVITTVICLFATDWGYNNIQESGPIDGQVDVSPVSGTVSFETNGKRKFIESGSESSDVIVIPNSEKQYYRKLCGETPSWAAPFNFGSCRTEIYSK